MITFLFTGGILIFSAITDLKYRKVYNFITFPSMLLGLILAGFPFAGESYYRLLWMVVLLIIGTFRVEKPATEGSSYPWFDNIS